MTDTDGGNGAPTAEGQDQAAPSVNVHGQYVKDLSFENPNAPQSLTPSENGPQISINVNVDANKYGDEDFEVVLTLEARAQDDDTVIFNTEIVYAGMFRIANVPEEHMHPFVLIECPRLLFPFARQIIADATRNGGFPPLMIDPIDFAALYQQNMMQAAGGANLQN